MIQKNELRIGNWVLDGKTGKNVQVDGIQFTGRIVVADDDYDDYKRGIDPQPIPIKPELLQKCGFKNLHEEYCEAFRLSPFYIELLPDSTILIKIELGIESYAYVLKIDRSYGLHKLQNLFFAITNQELKIEL